MLAFSLFETLYAYLETLRFRLRSVDFPNGLGASESILRRIKQAGREELRLVDGPKCARWTPATRSFCRLQKYHALHGEYLSSRITPIPGTDKGQLLIVKPHRSIKEEDDDHGSYTFRKPSVRVRAELEWRLFTEFRPMLPFLSA